MYFILITRISLDKKAIMSNIRTLLYHYIAHMKKAILTLIIVCIL